MKTSNQQAIYALSGDPWTKGHEQVFNDARERYDNVLIGIADAPNKNYSFARWERTRLAQASLPGIDSTDIRIIPRSLAHYMKRQGIPSLIRGVRNIVDEAYEKTLEFYYRHEYPEIEIDRFCINPDSPYAEVSSSNVKESLKIGHTISDFVSSRVKQALESRLIEQYPIGITGEMGAGKSYISKKLVETAHSYGIACTHIELDTIAHDIYSSLTDPIYVNAREKIKTAFWEELMDENGWIDRTKLAKIFRERSDTKEILDAILREPILLRYKDILFGKKGIILVDSALLIEFGSTHFSNHHVAFIQADIGTRTERVIERYAKNGRTMNTTDVHIMFSYQSSAQEKRNTLETTIQEANNGSSLILENGETNPDMRKAFFSILNNIDISGELRTKLILKKLGLSDLECAASYAELKKLHEEPHRFYHTWEHITESLNHLFDYAVSEDLTDDQVAILGGAILFHDGIYEVDKTYYQDNEARSANASREWMEKKGVRKDWRDEIYTLIQETAHGRRDIRKWNLLSRILHDLDLAILGAPESRYKLYVRDIVTEFGIYTNREFKEKRKELLWAFLKNPDLYLTEYGKSRFDVQARENLAREIVELSK